MIHIQKQKEPEKLIQFKRLNASRNFDDLDGVTKMDLRNHLLAEQGYLCAYCMCRIGADNSKIEHYEPRNNNNQLEYSNLLAVCKGNEGSRAKHQTCDTKKGDSILNLDPQDSRHIKTIKYNSQGVVMSSNSKYDEEINTVLNLNCVYGYLVDNRYAALNSIKRRLSKYSGHIAVDKIAEFYEYYSNKKQEMFEPYVGIILWYLARKMK